MAASTGTRSRRTQELLGSLVKRSQRRTGPRLSIPFLRGGDDDDQVPALAFLLRGGRGGEVRLKLYLSMKFLATKPPHDIRSPMPARTWAEMLGLSDPEGAGARRIADAIKWLNVYGYIKADHRPGRPPSIEVKDPASKLKHYTAPKGTRWVVAPHQLWSNEWIVVLSGSALALFIVLLEITNSGKVRAQSIPTTRKREYGFSDDTWARAIRELVDAGLVTVGVESSGPNFDLRRQRNTYTVEWDRFERGPAKGAQESTADPPTATE